MQTNPIADKLHEPVSSSLEYSLSLLRDILRAPHNSDVVIRRITIAGFASALVFLDGMVDTGALHLSVLEPAMRAAPYGGDPAERALWLSQVVLAVSGLTLEESLDRVLSGILQGNVALLADGCPLAIVIDAKGYQKRAVEKPTNETVVTGPHEAFVESMKVNMTLLRRILQTPRLVFEHHQVGAGVKTGCSLVYLDGVANEGVLKEVRRRLAGINLDYVMTIGELEQLIEDSPYSLLPQFVHTERPDRAASFLIGGMAVLLVEGSPTVLSLPATLVHLLNTPDMNTMRFPYGTFKRIVVTFGILITALLPSLYLSVSMFQTEVLPLELLNSIYEAQSRVPIPLVYALLFLSLGFDLILEAGARMPGVLANGLGAISALILGQAVVAADLVSPITIIVVAVSGLGALIVPEHGLTLGIRILQLLLLIIASVAGFYGLLLALLFIGVELCSHTSMGVPIVWHSSPERMHNPDIVGRYPIWQQRIRLYLSNPGKLLRAMGRVRLWDRGNKRDG